MAGKEGGDVSRAVGTDPGGRGRDRVGGWLPIWPEEVAAAFADRKAAEWRASWARVSGLVVREEGLGLLRAGGGRGGQGRGGGGRRVQHAAVGGGRAVTGLLRGQVLDTWLLAFGGQST